MLINVINLCNAVTENKCKNKAYIYLLITLTTSC